MHVCACSKQYVLRCIFLYQQFTGQTPLCTQELDLSGELLVKNVSEGVLSMQENAADTENYLISTEYHDTLNCYCYRTRVTRV